MFSSSTRRHVLNIRASAREAKEKGTYVPAEVGKVRNSPLRQSGSPKVSSGRALTPNVFFVTFQAEPSFVISEAIDHRTTTSLLPMFPTRNSLGSPLLVVAAGAKKIPLFTFNGRRIVVE